MKSTDHGGMQPQSPGWPKAVSVDRYLRRMGSLWLIPLAALASLLVSVSIYQVHRQRSSEVAAWAQHLAAEFDADLRLRLQAMQALAAWSRAEHHPASSLNDWYGHARAFDQTFDTPLVLVDGQRQMLRHSRVEPGRALPQLPRPSGRSAYQDALDSGSPQVGDPVPGPVLKTRVVPLFLPIQGPAPVLMALVPAQRFNQLLLSQRIPSGWSAALLDRGGQVIASTAEDAPAGELLVRDARHVQARVHVAPFTVVVVEGAWSFYRPHLIFGGTLLLAVGLTLAVAGMAARRAGHGLAAAVRGLIPASTDRAPALRPSTAIIEIESVRQALQLASESERRAERHERERIARDLHDGLQQEVALARLNLEAVLMESGGDRALQQSMRQTLRSLDKVGQEIRQVVKALRPATLEQLGLAEALAALARQLQDATGVQVELEIVGEEQALERVPAEVADAVYRIVQESLNNVRKHAQASFAHVVVEVDDPAQLSLRVSDDGVGLPQPLAG